MAFINKNDFSIVAYVMDYKTADEYFECDDMIAPAISLLNKKGYKTTFCCSGHPFAGIDEALHMEYPTEEEIKELNIYRIESSEAVKDRYNDTDEYPYYVVNKCNFVDTFYVAFAETYTFPKLPGQAYLDEGNIYWKSGIRPTEIFEGITKIYEMNKEFYEWVEKLPSLIKEK